MMHLKKVLNGSGSGKGVGAEKAGALSEDVQSAVTYFQQARTLQQEGRLSEAVEIWERFLKRVALIEARLRRDAEGHDRPVMIGSGAAMTEVRKKLEMVASSDTTVLITGETGTGKELAADAIHYLGHRQAGPLVKVNCAVLTEELLASERPAIVVGDDVARAFEPPERELGENGPFVRDRLVQHDVEGAQSVGGDEQQVLAKRIHLSDLALPDERQVQLNFA